MIRQLLLVVSILLALVAAATLLPLGVVVSDLGYKTYCPFAPWSTLMLAIPAWIAWAVRSYMRTRLT